MDRFLGEENRDPTLVQKARAKLIDASLISTRFDVMGLSNVFLRGIGEERNELALIQKADAFAGVLAALFLTRSSLDALRLSVVDVTAWLSASVDQLYDKFLQKPHEIDAKTSLQEQLQRLGVTWRFHYEVSGPAHDRAYITSLTLSSHATGEVYSPIIRGQGRSQKDAEVALAVIVARAIERINSNADEGEPGGSLNDGEYRRLARFLYRHELEVAPSDLADARRWLKDRLLGSHLLMSGQKEAFLGWANRVECCSSRMEEGFRIAAGARILHDTA